MLNAEQIAQRKHTLGGSDVGCLMNGDAKKIDRLYREKIGELAPEDLSDVWPVQLGSCTEPLNLDWYERKHRQIVSRRGDVIGHPYLPWAAVTLDGWINELHCPIEAKHVGGREPIEVIFERYAPQVQWQMECTGSNQCALSIIMATAEPVVEFIERNTEYADELVRRGSLFMSHVRNRTPPVDLPAVPAPIDASKVYDMERNNAWGASASVWLELRDSAAAYDDAAKILKSLVPPDAKKCFGHNVMITRNRVGHLSLREQAE
jgi:predicted phage-related endonuclease